MPRLRTAPARLRCAWAAAFALLLALRLLSPAGFMPAFDRGAVTIVACPDAQAPMLMPGHQPGDHWTVHQPCPYAAASSLGALGADFAPLLAIIDFGAPLLPAPARVFAERTRTRERPPSRGPPIPA